MNLCPCILLLNGIPIPESMRCHNHVPCPHLCFLDVKKAYNDIIMVEIASRIVEGAFKAVNIKLHYKIKDACRMTDEFFADIGKIVLA